VAIALSVMKHDFINCDDKIERFKMQCFFRKHHDAISGGAAMIKLG